jgi:hypothetical protein
MPETLHDTVHSLAYSLVNVAREIQADTLPSDPAVARAEFDQRAARQHVVIAAAYASALLRVLEAENHTIYLDDLRCISESGGRLVVSWMGQQLVLPKTSPPPRSKEAMALEAKISEVKASLGRLSDALDHVHALVSRVERSVDMAAAAVGVS